ncbi:glycosyltransferase family 2 protein [Marinomonas sp.]|uniref:glycosyltransferase family 2 protein n=1 Tax=Marinomonas sp. TaxID=1904862 RepID=UPI003F975450
MNDTVKRIEGGREIIHGAKQSTFDQPLITIITSTYNAAKDLHWTIDSIRAQTYPNIQWIIADGGSKDESVELFKQNEDVIDYWFSEPDKGIYDAWNKALKHAKGDWVQFIGAGDEYYQNSTLDEVSKIVSKAYPVYEMVYGRVKLLDQNRKPIGVSGIPWNEMKGSWQGIRPMLPVHPEVFHHKSILMNIGGFNAKYKISADTEFMYKSMYKKDPLYIDVFIDKLAMGGVSTDPESLILIYNELKSINHENSISPPLINRLKTVSKVYIKYFIYRYFSLSFFRLVSKVYACFVKRKI